MKFNIYDAVAWGSVFTVLVALIVFEVGFLSMTYIISTIGSGVILGVWYYQIFMRRQ